ncbi:MAG: bifunctional glutamate N-acetyltransferase/amino-acid acetyltransferase ArgJ [Caldilineae bacterium]|nr:MAG: bifunctional glutamate N-acetyltransferase/amino-acid acetyltransferase ArgJ [Caldilineae bacterium]
MTPDLLTLPQGYSFAAHACGIKPQGALDLALVFSEIPCAAAALFTQNRYAAAPVQYDRQLLSLNPTGVQAVLINSGNANAITGSMGLAATRRSAEAVEAVFGLAPWSTLVMSTGVIGVPLPVERIERAVPALHQSLQADAEALERAARAIMTTDTRPKVVSVQGQVAGVEVTVAGMAKGAGMIHPNMATMLAVLVSDVAATPHALHQALTQAVNVSFNRISVDGDTSTNDTVTLLANGLAGNPVLTEPDDAGFREFTALLQRACVPLAQDIVRDGEGATRFVTVEVTGLADDDQAHRLANAIAVSPLVKTAIYGGDANWGRILAAAGNSGVAFDPAAAALWISGGESAAKMLPLLQIVDGGAPLPYSEEEASRRFAQPELLIRLQMGDGPGRATMWTCDLSHDYVTINGEYRT